MSLPVRLSALFLLATSACNPAGTDTFVREEQNVAVNFALLTGTSRADLWSVGTVNLAGVDTQAVVHSRSAGRWDALTLAELSLGQGGQVQGLAVSAKNEVWVANWKSSGPGLWLVNGNGGIEDHSSEIPVGVATSQILELTNAGGTLLVGVSSNSAAPNAHLYRRVGTTLEPLPGLEAAAQYTVLAARSADDLYLSLSKVVGSKLVHYVNGVSTEIPWPTANEGPPSIVVSSTGETWLWKTSGSQSPTFSGNHADGTTFTPWTTQGWPEVAGDNKVSQRPVGMVPVGPGKLAMLAARTDGAAIKDTERTSLGVNHLDAQGKVTVGPRLVQCLSPEECAVGQGAFVVLPDGTVIILGNGGSKVWFTGPSSSLR